jgi:hypothetical protein
VPTEIEDALAAWRDAERRLGNAVDGDREALQAEVERHRDTFQRLSVAYMEERIDALHEAEARRRSAAPSTDPFHEAARDEKEIAADIFETARVSDEQTP